MKTIILTLFLFISAIVSAQVRLGSSASDIRSECSDSEYELESGYSNDIYYIKYKTEGAVVTHLFDEDSTAVMGFISPDDLGVLHSYVEMYNNRYVIISDKEWKMYTGSGVVNISLVLEDDGSYLFKFSSQDFANESQNYDDGYAFIKPYVETQNNSVWGNANVVAVDIIRDMTVVTFEYITAPYVVEGWIALAASTKIVANNGAYKSAIISWALHDDEAGSLSDLDFNDRYAVESNKTYLFSMIFPKIPENIHVINVIEDADSETAFNWKGIHLVKTDKK